MGRRLCVLVALCAMFGCQDTTGRRLSNDEFVERADGICARSRAKTRAVRGPKDESLKEVARVLEKTLPIQREALDRLGELDAPDGRERDLERYVADLRSSLRDLEDAQEAAEDDDRRDFEDAQARAQDRFGEIQERARGLGLKTCSGG